MEILAVDDEELALFGLEKSIREADPAASVHACRTAEAALACARDTHLDVAFLDIQLRGPVHGIELAYRLKELIPGINIIFTTGYREYMGEAFALHASGYIMKPVTAAKVEHELADLRNPAAPDAHPNLSVRCFGNFEVFFGGSPVRFHYSKTKELFAYLVDRSGASVTGAEVCAALWEDASGKKATKAYLRNIYADLKGTFEQLGCEDVLIKGRNSYAVRRDAFWCDRYEFEKGDVTAINSFHNEYMAQYSWAEFRIGELWP